VPSSKPEIVVERVRPGQDWLTWKGALRDYHDVQGRIAWNAYIDGELAGSAQAQSRWAGTEMHGDLWAFIDRSWPTCMAPT
jgi:hypothetical protein